MLCAGLGLAVACGPALDEEATHDDVKRAGLVNGGFEDGLYGWTRKNYAQVTEPRSGTGSAEVGSRGVNADVDGESAISQRFYLPKGRPALSFWYRVHCGGKGDWVTATLIDPNGPAFALPHVCETDSGWVHVTWDVSRNAGHRVTLSLQNHDDNQPGTPTWSQFDDVEVTDAAEVLPADALFVSSRHGGVLSVARLDPHSGTTGAPIAMPPDVPGDLIRAGRMLHDVGLAPDGKEQVYSIDVTTGATTAVASPGAWHGLTAGSMGGELVRYECDLSGCDVRGVDWTTGKVRRIGRLTDPGLCLGAMVSGTTLYAVASDSRGMRIHTMDLQSGASKNVPLAHVIGSLARGTFRGKLVTATSYAGLGAEIFESLDPATGALTPLQGLGNTYWIWGETVSPSGTLFAVGHFTDAGSKNPVLFEVDLAAGALSTVPLAEAFELIPY